MLLQPLGKQSGGDQELIELGHCIALSSFDALRKYKKVFLLCTLLSGVEEREREREEPRVGYNVVAPYLPACAYLSSAYSRE